MTKYKTPVELVRENHRLFRAEFQEWLSDNGHVYDEFEKRALRVAAVRKHYSGYTILETMRHDTVIGELHSRYKLNNTHCADLCRVFALMHPQHCDLFEFRKRKPRLVDEIAGAAA